MRREGITAGGAGARESAAPRAARLRRRQRHEHRAPARLLRDDCARSRRISSCRRGSPRSRWTRWPRPRARRFAASNRTIGWFDPVPVGRATTTLRRRPPRSGLMRALSSRRGSRPGRPRAVPRRSRQRRSSSSPSTRTRRRPSTINLAMRAGSICDPAGLPGAMYLLSRVDRPRHRDALGRPHRRGARRPRHRADRHRHAASLLDRLHVPRRGLRVRCSRSSATS